MSQVFISYRQTDDEQKQRVRSFGERLRGFGINVILDQFFLENNPSGPEAGWAKWSGDHALETDYVIIVGTRDWFQSFDKTQPPGTGLGSASEADDLRQRIYEAGGVIDNIRVVLFDDADAAHIPGKLNRYHRFHAERDFPNIVRWLGGTVPMDTVEAPRGARSTISDLVSKFYGNDPIVGEEAANELLKDCRAEVIEALVPLEAGLYRGSPQVEIRLKQVASTLGVEIVPHLARAISLAPWSSKLTAAVCFSGLKSSRATEDPLIEILKTAGNFDAERLAIESLGRLGANQWSYELERFARRGIWKPDSDAPGRISNYAFEKISSYVLEALTRFAATAADRDNAERMFRDLASFIALRQTHLPNVLLSSYMLVERLSREFTVWSVDPLILHWGSSTDDDLQRLCTDILREIAPVRAAKYLLETAISPTKSESVRRGASFALGELRVPQVAQRLADTLRNPMVDRTFLDWAFSTLYAIPADWSGLSSYVEELLAQDNEQADQLHYSLAFKGDNRCQKDLIERLDDSRPFTRWTSALALARLLGPKARVYLEHRADDTGDAFERCAMYAAIVRAGDHEKGRALHNALTEATEVSSLPSIWKLEILDAFRVVKPFNARAFPLWRDANQVGARQLQYFDSMTSAVASSPPSGTTTSKPKASGKRRKIFISYSHKDVKWLDRLQVHLKPLERSSEIIRWDDTLIKPGEKWQEMIKSGLEEAKVAVLLISADFLASDFIDTNELPPLLAASASEGLVILPILLSPSRFIETKSLSQFQSVNPPSKPLNKMRKGDQEDFFVKVTRVIEEAMLS